MNLFVKLIGPSPSSIGGNKLTTLTIHLGIHLVSPGFKWGFLPAIWCGGWRIGSLQLFMTRPLVYKLIAASCLLKFCKSLKPLEGILCREDKGYCSCDKIVFKSMTLWPEQCKLLLLLLIELNSKLTRVFTRL